MFDTKAYLEALQALQPKVKVERNGDWSARWYVKLPATPWESPWDVNSVQQLLGITPEEAVQKALENFEAWRAGEVARWRETRWEAVGVQPWQGLIDAWEGSL